MSIALGIYEVFANIIPGFVYLFVFYNLVIVLGTSPWNVNTVNVDLLPYYGLMLLGLAYIVGHVMDFVSYRLWIRVLYRQFSEFKAYKQFQEKYSELGVTFKPEQAPLLFNIIRQNNYQLSLDIEKNKVICVMLRNISFGLFLLFIILIYGTFKAGFYYPALMYALMSLVASIVTVRRGELMNEYYYRLIFENAAIYGKDLTAMMSKGKSNTVSSKRASK